MLNTLTKMRGQRLKGEGTTSFGSHIKLTTTRPDEEGNVMILSYRRKGRHNEQYKSLTHEEGRSVPLSKLYPCEVVL